jgi:hypothetical protein
MLGEKSERRLVAARVRPNLSSERSEPASNRPAVAALGGARQELSLLSSTNYHSPLAISAILSR